MPEEAMVMIVLFIGLPWLVLHYITKWKTTPTLTNDDEALLEELYQLARRLDDRVETVERLVAADNPSFNPRRQIGQDDETDNKLNELDRLLNRRTAK